MISNKIHKFLNEPKKNVFQKIYSLPQAVMVLLLNCWAAVLVTLALATLVLQLLGTMALLGVKLSAVPAVLLVLAIGRGVHFTVHLCLVRKPNFQ